MLLTLNPLTCFLLIAILIHGVSSWRASGIAKVIAPHRKRLVLKSTIIERAHKLRLQLSTTDITISPFDKAHANSQAEVNGSDNEGSLSEPLSLTLANVEIVLDEVRPHLQADGGDVVLQGITINNVVQVTLVGACGSCPMSTVTMKMGLERTLKQRIPSITAVEQVAAPVPVLNTEAVEVVLEGVRPIVSVAGGTVGVVNVNSSSGQPSSVILHMIGTAAALQSVKIEIVRRVQKQFGTAVLVEWTH